MYLSQLANNGRKVATIERALAAIAEAQRAAEYANPRQSAVVRSVLQGIRRTKGTAQNQKTPISIEDLHVIVAALPDGGKGVRDRAILLLGFAGAFRRSELTALDVADLSVTSEGLTVTLRRSKTDQEGAGRKVGIPRGNGLCPVRAVTEWLAWLQARLGDGVSTAGPLFRTFDRHGRLLGNRLDGKDIADLIKTHAKRAGLDATRFSGHSLRAGLATAAAKAGKSERTIMAQTGHKSATMVRRYIRDADLFGDNAAKGIGL